MESDETGSRLVWLTSTERLHLQLALHERGVVKIWASDRRDGWVDCAPAHNEASFASCGNGLGAHIYSRLLVFPLTRFFFLANEWAAIGFNLLDRVDLGLFFPSVTLSSSRSFYVVLRRLIS